MSVQTDLTTTGHGLARAERRGSDEWSVEALLTYQDVRCLTADPLHPHVLYAGTQGHGVLRSNDGGKTWREEGGNHAESYLLDRASFHWHEG